MHSARLTGGNVLGLFDKRKPSGGDADEGESNDDQLFEQAPNQVGNQAQKFIDGLVKEAKKDGTFDES